MREKYLATFSDSERKTKTSVDLIDRVFVFSDIWFVYYIACSYCDPLMLWLGLGCTILTVSTGLICRMHGAQLHLYTVTYISISRVMCSVFNSFWHTQLPLSVPFIPRFVLVSSLPCFFYDTLCFSTACHSSPSSVSYHEFGVTSSRWAFNLCYGVRPRTGDYCDDDDDLQCFFVCLFLYLVCEKVVCFYCEVGKTYIKARVRFESVFS